MGGIGSGRTGGDGCPKLEASRSLDVNKLNRAGYLQNRHAGGWHWTVDDKPVASINLRCDREKLHLSYRYRFSGGDWDDISHSVCLDWEPCRFGGERPYFVCPGVVNGNACRGRVLKLYGAGRYFCCRHCYGLVYASQGEDQWDRAFRRANKIRRRLGGEAGLSAPLPARPKGMWRTTYHRLINEILEAEEHGSERLHLMAAKLLNRRPSIRSCKVGIDE